MPGAITKRARSSRGKVVPAISKKGTAILANFARVSKPQSALPKDLAVKAVPSKPAAKTESIEIRISCSKKRKAPIQDENACPGNDDLQPQQQPLAAPRSTKRRQLGTLQNNVQRPQTPRSTEDGDLFGTLERLKLQSSPSAPRRGAAPAPAPGLPRELLDLINLQAAFTKALSIHHVHNGTAAPVDVNELCPSITQAWGKRKVVLEDVRRCIGVLTAARTPNNNQTSAAAQPDVPFFLSDYGRGKVCIELHAQAPTILNEARLNQAFEAGLKQLWSSSRTGASATDVKRFIATLPQAPLAACESRAKAQSSGARKKVQVTLEELKQSVELKKQAEAERKAKAAAAATSGGGGGAGLTNADGSKMSLIDRIRYKEALKSQQQQQGLALTPEQLQRRAALQRVGDVAAVISMLSTATAMGRKRVAFTMPAVLTKLKDSLQVPISREEGAACVRLLATDVAPEWLKVVTIGGRDNVVVLPDFTPSKAVIQDRVGLLSA